MYPDLNYAKALRDCCRDEAAFVQLQAILACAINDLPTPIVDPQVESDQPRLFQSGEGGFSGDSQQTYKAILDATPDCMLIFNRQGQCLDFRSNCSGVETPQENYIGRYLDEFLPLDIAALGLRTIRQTLDTGNLQTCEYQLLTPEGVQNYEARLVVSGDNQVLAIVRDVTERKQAEAALIKSEQWYRALIQYSTDVIQVVDCQGIYQYVSPASLQVLGYQPEELVGRSCWDILHPEEIPALQALFERTLQQPGVLVSTTFRVQHKNGHWVHLEAVGRNLLEEPAVGGVVVNVRDVTERKQAEEALQVSEEKYSKSFRQSPDFLTISTLDEGRYVEVNETFLRFFGYQREEVIGHTASELNIWIYPEQRDRMKQQLQEAGAVTNLECDFRIKSGAVCTGLLSAEVIRLNGVDCLLAVTNDITERKQAEAKLQMRAKRDRLLSEMAQRIRQSLDCNQILKTTVAEVRQFLNADRVFVGFIESDRQCQIVAESVSPDSKSCLGKIITGQDYIEEARVFHQQNEVLAIDDITTVTLSPTRTQFFTELGVQAVLGVPIVLDNVQLGFLVAHQCDRPRHWQTLEKELLQMLATQVAIAIQQGQLYQQVQDLNANLERQVEERTQALQYHMHELQNLNQFKDMLLHAVTHDLRTPVFGTLMLLKSLLRQSNQTNLSQSTVPISRTILEKIVQSCDRQVHLINSLLQTYSDEAPEINLYREPIQLRSLSDAIIEKLNPQLEKNQATVTNIIAEDLPPVLADVSYLKQVLEQLICNTLKHNPPGRKIRLEATVERKFIRFAIADDGEGLTPQQQKRLFDLYVRGLDSHHLTGIGLGLYLCRQIITAHGGQIGAISQPGQGATFWFTLAIAPTPQKYDRPALTEFPKPQIF